MSTESGNVEVEHVLTDAEVQAATADLARIERALAPGSFALDRAVLSTSYHRAGQQYSHESMPGLDLMVA